MYRILSGSARGLADTEGFVARLGRLPTPAADLFEWGREVFVTRAPGRLDLMGGIADYSGSLVLQLPTAAAAHVALQTRGDETLRVVSLPAGAGAPAREFEMRLGDFRGPGGPVEYEEAAARFCREPGRRWAAYVAGAFLVLMRERGCDFTAGASILVASDVPEGKGVSSSAALEVAVMGAVAAGYGITLGAAETAFLCQKVENLVACAPCGVMDQMASACGEEGALLAILCQPGEVKGVTALPEGLAVWGVDSGLRHSVGGADYGTVRTAAFMGYRVVADMAGLPVRGGAGAGRVVVEDPRWGGYLANVTPDEFEGRFAAGLPELMSGADFLGRYGGITDPVTSVEPARVYPVLAATRHPVYEHARVNAFAGLLAEGAARAGELGELMYRSHESYSSCGLGSPGTDELVRLVREAGPAAGLYGAKITGGGSGGTVAVLGRADARPAVEAVAREYAGGGGRGALVIEGSSPGAHAFGHLKLLGDN